MNNSYNILPEKGEVPSCNKGNHDLALIYQSRNNTIDEMKSNLDTIKARIKENGVLPKKRKIYSGHDCPACQVKRQRGSSEMCSSCRGDIAYNLAIDLTEQNLIAYLDGKVLIEQEKLTSILKNQAGIENKQSTNEIMKAIREKFNV